MEERVMETNKLNFAVHPGKVLASYLKTLKMTQKQLANKTGINKTVINEIISGKRSITTDIALKFEPVFQMPASYWRHLQTDFEETVKRLNSNNLFEEVINEKSEQIEVADNQIVEYTVKTKIGLLAA